MKQSPREWPAELVAQIATSVKYHRTSRRPKLSTQKVADRCAELGLPSLTRSVITSIELGTRDSISIPEWLVLAEALDVPPLLMLWPLGRVEVVDALPGQRMSPLEAILWAEQGRANPTDSAVYLFRQHAALVREWEERTRQVEEWSLAAAGKATFAIVSGYDDEGTLVGEPPSADLAARELELVTEYQGRAQGNLLMIRRRITEELGLTPPSLPPLLQFLDDDEPVPAPGQPGWRRPANGES